MALFGRKQRFETGSLTCILSAHDDCWQITWTGEGRNEPPDFEADTLTEAIDQAATAALALYVVGPRPPGAELNFAIYPWAYGQNGAIYDVSGTPGQFRARDTMGSDREVDANSLEGLVAAVGTQPGGGEAMLRWARPFAELPAESLD